MQDILVTPQTPSRVFHVHIFSECPSLSLAYQPRNYVLCLWYQVISVFCGSPGLLYYPLLFCAPSLICVIPILSPPKHVHKGITNIITEHHAFSSNGKVIKETFIFIH